LDLPGEKDMTTLTRFVPIGETPTARDKADLAKSTRKIKELQKEIDRNYYDYGLELLEVQGRELYRAGKFTSFNDYLKNGIQESRTQAYKYIRIADNFGREAALKYGVEKLDAALTFIIATPEDESPDDIPDLEIPVTTKTGRLLRKSMEDVTIRELKDATQEVNQREQAKKLRKQPGSKPADQFLELARKLLDDAQLESTKVVVEPGEKEPKVSVHNIKLVNAWRTFLVLAKAAKKL
jgi:hypothetical protein